MTYLSNTRTKTAFRRTARVSLLDLFSLARQRRELANLSEHMLTDIGKTRNDAEVEARRGFWDVPDHWLK